MFLLDTDTLIYLLKGEKAVQENLQRHAKDPKALSVISYGELVFGAEKSKKVQENLAKVFRLREILPIIDVSPAVMDIFGKLKAELEHKGTPIDDFDLIIGATALSLGYRVVTNNTRHFVRIKSLKLANWLNK